MLNVHVAVLYIDDSTQVFIVKHASKTVFVPERLIIDNFTSCSILGINKTAAVSSLPGVLASQHAMYTMFTLFSFSVYPAW